MLRSREPYVDIERVGGAWMFRYRLKMRWSNGMLVRGDWYAMTRSGARRLAKRLLAEERKRNEGPEIVETVR